MLFTDSDVTSAADLLQIDSEVSTVANASKPAIVVDGAGSICELAWRQCGQKILTAQQLYSSVFVAVGTSGSHQAAVNYIGGPARNQARTRLNQVVATESQYANTSSPIQLWLAYSALAMFYRDASARKGNDRFQEKYNRYLENADFQWRQLRQLGLPWIAQPLEAPGSKHGVNAGTWAVANLSTVAGSGTEQALQVAITYYDGSKYISEANTANAESGPSEILAFAQPDASVVRVSIASLNPPAGVMPQVGLSQGAYTPLNATHWILWLGAAAGPLYWQAAVPIGTKTFTLAGDPVLSGAMLGAGQYPDLLLVFQNLVGRG